MEPPRIRVGSGFDIHQVSSDSTKPLILGGVVVAPGFGLIGHSDADVLTHAICDALLGAAGLGGLGDHFPDTDPELEGADSIDLLLQCLQMLGALGWHVLNCDATVIAQKPRLAEFLGSISVRLGAVVGAPVSVKAKSPEEVGDLGRNLGVMSLASALLWQP